MLDFNSKSSKTRFNLIEKQIQITKVYHFSNIFSKIDILNLYISSQSRLKQINHIDQQIDSRPIFYNINQSMKRVEELRSNFYHILSKYSGPTRKLLLQSLKQQLRQQQSITKRDQTLLNKGKLEITQTNDTSNSQISLISNYNFNQHDSQGRILSTSLTGSDQIFQLEARILEKQRLKITLNEEIQNYEDTYLGYQQTIFVKKEKTQLLQKQIARKTFQISRESVDQGPQPENSRSFAQKIREFFLF